MGSNIKIYNILRTGMEFYQKPQYLEEELEILAQEHNKIFETFQEIIDSLDYEYNESCTLLEKMFESNTSKVKKEKNIISSLSSERYSINIGLIHSINEHLKSIIKILEVTKANNDGRSYLVTFHHTSSKNKNLLKYSQNVELDPLKFSDQNKFNTEITFYKQQMRDSFTSAVSATCSNIYTIKLKSFLGDEDEKQRFYSNGSAQIDDNDLHLLRGFRQLSVLNLEESVITDNAIEFIRDQFQGIKQLTLNGCYMLTDRGIRMLAECSQLVTLNINRMNGLTPECLLQLIQNATNLNYLQIGKNSQIKQNFLFLVQKVYSDHQSTLKWLQITSDFGIDLYINQLSYLTTSNPGQQITDDQFITLIGERPLQYTGIYFGSCQQLTKKSITTIVKKCHSTNIERLCLAHFIRLTDSLVQDFTLAMPNLQYLDLRYCYNITDNSLFFISRNILLKYLDLEKCLSITDEGIAHLVTNMRSVKNPQPSQMSPTKLKSKPNLLGSQSMTYSCPLIKLNLSFCSKITDKSIFIISEYCKSMKALNITHCEQVTDQSIDNLSRSLRLMEKISLNHCEGLTDSSISMIATRLPHLKILQIQWCEVSQKCVRYIAQNLNNLTVLNLSHSPGVFSQEITLIAKNISGLTQLKLQSCTKIQENGLMAVGEYLTHLKVLCVKQCEQAVTDTFIKTLVTNNKNLEVLDISWCRNISNMALFHIAKSCFNLKVLNLNGCIDLDDRGMQWLSATVAPLRYLNLTLCSNLTDDGIYAITQNMRELRNFSICQLPEITDLGISSISNLNKLEELQLRGCKKITSISLIGLLYNLERLTELDISECGSIEGESLGKICQFMGNIKILEISEIQVDDLFLQELALNCPKLTQLNLCYCHQVTDEGVLRLIQKLPRLIRIHLQSTNISDRTMRMIAHALNQRKMEKIVIQ